MSTTPFCGKVARTLLEGLVLVALLCPASRLALGQVKASKATPLVITNDTFTNGAGTGL